MFSQLYYFSEVYRYRSISYTADILHISRQALSQSIRNLENVLGVELFIRSKNGVQPTKAADMLYESSQIILAEESRIMKNIHLFKNTESKKIKYLISAPRAYVTTHGEWLITALSDMFPNQRFTITIINNSEDEAIPNYDINLQSKIMQQSRSSMKIPNDYYCRLIKKFPLYVLVRKDHELRNTNEITYASLRPYKLSTLRNMINGRELSIMLNLGYDPNVEIPINLKEDILEEGHYTFDLCLKKNQFILEEIFGDDDRFLRIKTEEISYLYIIYKKTIMPEIISNLIKLVDKSFSI